MFCGRLSSPWSLDEMRRIPWAVIGPASPTVIALWSSWSAWRRGVRGRTPSRSPAGWSLTPRPGNGATNGWPPASFDAIAAEAIDGYDKVIGLDLSKVAIDGSSHKPPVGGEGTGKSPTCRHLDGKADRLAEPLEPGTIAYPLSFLVFFKQLPEEADPFGRRPGNRSLSEDHYRRKPEPTAQAPADFRRLPQVPITGTGDGASRRRLATVGPTSSAVN
jgi:hypothetical protein